MPLFNHLPIPGSIPLHLTFILGYYGGGSEDFLRKPQERHAVKNKNNRGLTRVVLYIYLCVCRHVCMMKKTVQYFNIHMPYLPVPLLFQSLQLRYKEAVHVVFVWIEAASAIHLRRKVESLETTKPKKQTAIDF